MSKKRHARNAKRTSTSVKSDVTRIMQREFLNEPRFLFTGWGLLLLGLLLWFLASHFMWNGWILTLIDPFLLVLLGVGGGLVICTTIGIAQGK